MSAVTRRTRRRRAKLVKTILAWIPVVILVLWAIWQLDSIETMQVDTLNAITDINIAMAVAEPVCEEYDSITATVTAYCEGTINAAGETPMLGTIAAPRCIPFGTKVRINGVVYTVMDRTNIRYDKGLYDPETRFDIYMGDQEFEKCYQWGKQVLTVEILEVTE